MATAEERQQAVDALTQAFVADGRDPAESREVAEAVIDHAIATGSDKRVTDAAAGSTGGSSDETY